MNIERKPAWLKINLSAGNSFSDTSKLLESLKLSTVCKSAKCPNRGECWAKASAAFMILGENCTRACKFCAVSHNTPTPPDPTEAERLAEAVKILNLKHACITSVTRDDLSDGGASHWASVIKKVKVQNTNTKLEVLVPDFCGDTSALQTVFEAKPDIFNHNLETVKALQKSIRGKADYKTSLFILSEAKKAGFITKSGIMLGLGESKSEIEETILDLKNTAVDILTIGQYIAPSKNHAPIARWVEPSEFNYWKHFALDLGFLEVQSSPLTRSSKNS